MGKTGKTGKHGAGGHRGKTDRKHLTEREVLALIVAATETSRNPERDRCLLLLMYRHGFRVSEICSLPLDHVDIEDAVLHVKRLKRGLSTTHPLHAPELKAIKAWLKIRAQMKPPATVKTLFISEQRKPLHRSTVNLLLGNASRSASLPFAAHPHMLRHACGFALADQGADTRLIQDYLGHRKIEHTVKYTATNPARFERLWR
ncbi:MAG: tyrosine-type recombinase/integrase [Terriglobia bacterium]